MTEAVVTNRTQTARQDVTQIAPNKLDSRDGLGLEAVGVTVFPKEGDCFVRPRDDPAVGDDTSRNVVAQVFDGMAAGACRLNMDPPTLGPDGGIDLPVPAPQLASEVFAEGCLQFGKMKKIIRLRHCNDFAPRIYSRAGNQEVDVRMKLHLLAPGMEHGSITMDHCFEPLCLREFFAHSSGNCCEKDVVVFLGEWTEEIRTQFLGQGKGHHEVGSIDLLPYGALNPVSSGGSATTRTGLVIAAADGLGGPETDCCLQQPWSEAEG